MLKAKVLFQIHSQSAKLLFLIVSSLLLAACGGGGAGTGSTLASAISVPATSATSATSQKLNTVVTPKAPTNIATLSWDIPSQRTDGSPLALSDIASYVIRYGTSPTNLNKIVNINDYSITSKKFTGLATPATWYFEIAAKDINGLESAFSAPVKKQFSKS